MTREQIHIGDMSHETAIGILKLMLEAMETYDGISPTPERINAVKMAIEALEQEPVLDKIRTEIKTEKLEDSPNFCVKAHNNAVDRVLGIIDKYKAESEET